MSEQIRGAGQPSWPLSPYQIQVSYGASPLSNPPPQAGEGSPLPNPPPRAGEGRVGEG